MFYSGEEFKPKEKTKYLKIQSINQGIIMKNTEKKNTSGLLKLIDFKNNYKILEFLYFSLRKRITTIKELLRLGFDFDIYTSSGSKNLIMIYDFVLDIKTILYLSVRTEIIMLHVNN